MSEWYVNFSYDYNGMGLLVIPSYVMAEDGLV